METAISTLQNAAVAVPEADDGGFISTLNSMGFMTSTLDPFSDRFVRHAADAKGPVLEIGAAYGVATLPALAAGASVFANDAEHRHLQILSSRVPQSQRERLTLVPGFVPHIEIEPHSIHAVLAARVFHFFPEEQLMATARAIAQWLVPGGSVYVVDDTPWLANSRDFIPIYEKRVANGERWPGMIDDVRPFRLSRYDQNCPSFFHFFDTESLARPFVEAGFQIRVCEIFARPDYPEHIQMDGREGIGLIATHP